jgi:hypothetical protein
MNEPSITREQLTMLGEADAVDIAEAARDFQWQPARLEDVIRRCLDERST